MSARRKRRAQNKKKRFSSVKSLGLILLFFTLLFFLIFQSNFWDSDSKLTLVVNKKDGDVLIAIFNPVVDEVTSITIPKNTQLKVARQLGTWKAGSIWQLGENEDLEGKLLQETITYHLKLPVVAWADSPAEGFVNGGLVALVKAVILPYKTNLKMGDRMKLAFFSFGVKNFKREEINLAETKLLKKTRLIDGEEGFVLISGLPASILALFSDIEISQKDVSVLIRNATGKKSVPEQVGEVIEVLGAKVAAIKKEESEEFDCMVLGKDQKAVEKLVQVFSCEKGKGLPSGSFDLEIKIGEGFARRF
ncbi:hypothetical protein KAT60_01585 [Candidatus Woesebacteria bacterium]|nr:hypothetical protein [Candidatus Woesebacteria bacterium]